LSRLRKFSARRRGHPRRAGVPRHGGAETTAGRRWKPSRPQQVSSPPREKIDVPLPLLLSNLFCSPVLAAAIFVDMPGRDHFAGLHDDLVAGILVLLPPKLVGRARVVCRRWRALTTDHHFVRASFSRWHAGHGHAITGFFYTPRFWEGSYYFPLDPEAEVGSSNLFAYQDPARSSGRTTIASSCSGLVLLIRWLRDCREIYVFNLLTMKRVSIGESGVTWLSLTLAFDPFKSQYYKVIALGNTHSVHVYSSETQTWRMAIHSDHSAGQFLGLSPVRGVFWNNSVVWIVAHSLVRFVIEEEHVTKMPMPPRKKDWICAYIGESSGHLQMVGYTKKEKLTACFDILEMQEDRSEWSVLFRVDLSRVKELYPSIEWPTWDTRHHQHKIIDYLALSPTYVIRGAGKTGQRALIFSIPGKIMSYNMKNNEISVVKEIGSPYQLELFWYSFYTYHPSLFAL
jgi:hypothetical protein